MGAGAAPQQGHMAMQSQQLAKADFTEPDRDTGDDHCQAACPLPW